MSLLKRSDEFAAENLAENADREEVLVVMGAYPVGVIARQAAGGGDAVDVGMVL